MIDWPKLNKRGFGREVFEATHRLHEREIFSDDGLARLLDEYPREDLGIWTFAAHGEGEAHVAKGSAGDMAGADILDAVKRGRIWLNLRATNERVQAYAPVADEIFASLEDAGGRKVLKPDMGVLISSPHVNVHYHLDIPLVALFQIRGEKRLWLYPAEEDFAPGAHIEAIALREKEEGLPFRNGFDDHASVHDLRPGMALTWPQTAPHRIQNGAMMNVSLSCEFMTWPTLVQANAIYANGVLRQKLGRTPARPVPGSASTIAKAGFARAAKLAMRPRQSAPTPVSFHLDLSEANCVRPLDRREMAA